MITKIWVFGIRRWCKNLLLLIDSLVCAFCFSLCIYNIYRYAVRPRINMLSPSLVKLCGITHYTKNIDTASTFAEFTALFIIYRLWYIQGYLNSKFNFLM